jgi:hypothetical protein
MNDIGAELAQHPTDPGSKHERDWDPEFRIQCHGQRWHPIDVYIVYFSPCEVRSLGRSNHCHAVPVLLEQRCYSAHEIINAIQMGIICVGYK